ncbi:MAG: glycosyltransferase [Candidatus Binatia bacterium]
MIRVAFLCDHLDLGGQELGCLEVVRGLDRGRFSAFVYAFRPGALVEDFSRLGVSLVVGHDKPGSDPIWTERDEAARGEYRKLLARRLRADAIDVALVYGWRDAIPALREAGVAAIVERIDGPGLARRIRDKSSCRRIVCESRMARTTLAAERALVGCDPAAIVVIPNGVDRRRFDPKRYDRDRCRAALGLGADDFVIGTVARLAPEKNITQLLNATAELAATLPPRRAQAIRVLVAGPDGGSRRDLEQEARALGIAGRVAFLGPRRDVPELLRAFDVFVLTSLMEGAPFALIEAVVMGLPVVATPVGAVPEIIDGNGMLVAAFDPHETSIALAELANDAALRDRLGRRSRVLARRYDVRRMVRRYEALLVEALEESRGLERAIAP